MVCGDWVVCRGKKREAAANALAQSYLKQAESWAECP